MNRFVVLALSIVALALAAPAPASARTNVVPFFLDLADQRLRQAPLVPATAPRSLSPLEDFVETFDVPRGYGVRMAAARRGRLHAIVALFGDQYPSAKVALRVFKRAGYRRRSTTIRGRRGYLLTRALPTRGRENVLLWVEGGVVYYMGTSTPNTVSLKELRATATGLDRAEGVFIGSDERGDNSAAVAATSHTVSVDVQFRAECIEKATGEPSFAREGTLRVAFVPRQGDSFSFDLAPSVDSERSDLAWQGTVSGTVGASGAAINLRATGSDAEANCDTGAWSLPLRPYEAR